MQGNAVERYLFLTKFLVSGRAKTIDKTDDNQVIRQRNSWLHRITYSRLC